MKGDKSTLKKLKDALERIIKGTPERIPSDSILTVSAVERGAGMGNGTGSKEDPKAAAIPVLPPGSAAYPDASASEQQNVTSRYLMPPLPSLLESILTALARFMSILFRPRGEPPILAADQDCAAASGDLRRPMKGDENTLKKLEAALKRIIEGNPEHIPPDRKLSVSAVEREAQMGNGSAYYYLEFKEKVKKLKKQMQSGQEGAVPRSVTHRLEDERRKAAKYRKVAIELRGRMSRMAADRHQEAYALMQALDEKQNLQDEKQDLQDELAKIRRERIGLIKPSTLDPK